MQLLSLVLLLLNLVLFLKLGYFGTIFQGKAMMFDYDAYHLLLNLAKEGINPQSTYMIQPSGPPLIFGYYLPYSYFPLEIARIIFTFVSLIGGAYLCYLLSKKYFKSNTFIFLILNLLFFSAFPTRFTLEMGQPNILITLFLTLAFFSKSSFLKSIFISFSSLMKSFYVLVTLAFARSRPRVFIYTAFFMIILVLIFSPIIKLEWYFYFLSHKLGRVVYAQEAISLNYYSQTIISSLSRIGVSQFFQEPIYYLSLAIFSLLSIWIGSFHFALISSLIISPIIWQHYFAVLFLPIVHLFVKMPKNRFNISLYALAVYLWWVEFPMLHNMSPGLLNGLLASHYLISAFLLLYLELATSRSR